ncbi:MAG: DUF423 domain-containing protein [Ostreibacterium sp.]
MNQHSKILFLLASLFGTSSIIFATIGAHGVHHTLQINHQLVTFGKAVDYAMYGGLVLIAIAVTQQLLPSLRIFISGYLIALGTLLFSGSLFLVTLAGISAMTSITPWGGTLLIFGWLALGITAIFSTTDNLYSPYLRQKQKG